ncbi:MAG: lysophospholipid acyltransferase family protein [Hyphomonadaceae bacterium]|nr:lysophospholipid acyltransferase family protein [Hyphomonadaceae bacterium]
MKSLLRSPIVSRPLGLVIWAWMALVGRTVRWTIEGSGEAKEAWETDRGLLVLSWHEQILLLPSGWTRFLRTLPKRPGGVSMLVSLSRDAEPVARAIDHFGVSTIRGSKSNARKRDKDKGGVRAISEAIRLLKADGALCITPDGPRGPAREISDGPILLAQRAGSLVMPYALYVSNHRRLKSWDRMFLPYPFGRGAIVFGTPVEANALSTEALKAELQTSLDQANRRARDLIEGAAHSSDPVKDAA